LAAITLFDVHGAGPKLIVDHVLEDCEDPDDGGMHDV